MKTNYKAGTKYNEKSSARPDWALSKASSGFRATQPKMRLRRQMEQPGRGKGGAGDKDHYQRQLELTRM